MKLSREWLSDFVDFKDIDDERFCELITTRVAEVDGMTFPGAAADSAVIAKVTASAKHPKRDNLTVVTVTTGGAPIEVICGAPNVRVGMLTAYLAPGAQFVPAKGEEGGQLTAVTAREIDGVTSHGILVSEKELGLTGDHSGIIDLTPEWLAGASKAPAAKSADFDGLVGKKLADIVPCKDTVLEIDNKSLTHRPDLWCHFGFARELAAILNRPLLETLDALADDTEQGAKAFAAAASGKSVWSVAIAPQSGCRRFTAVEIDGVAVVASPLWMRRRLARVGAGVRNVIVDLSNYCMHDIGQPNHTYDADALRSKTITVRRAASGEAFTALDGEIRDLCPDDIVIADDAGPIGLGGVMGGAETSVKDSTTRLVLENANFDPVTIRKTTVRYALRTDASNRFEKSLSAFTCAVGARRFLQLLAALQPQAKTVGVIVDTFPERPKAVAVPLRHDYIRGRLGAEVPDAQIDQMMTGLGFRIANAELQVPYYRATRDISIEDDIVEEVGRIFGYENVPERSPKIDSVAAPVRPAAAFEELSRDVLCGLGFSEAYLYSFMNPERANRAGYVTEQAIELLNPVDSTQAYVRTTLVPGLIEALDRNLKNTSQVLLFELGRGYERDADPRHAKLKFRTPVKNPAAFERRLLGLVYASGKDEKIAGTAGTPATTSGADFYAAADVVRRLVRKCARASITLHPLVAAGAPAQSSAGDYSVYKHWMHPFRAASISVNGVSIGVIAEVAPSFTEDSTTRAIVAELDLELLLEADTAETRFKPLSKYPDSFFEVSVVAPVSAYACDVEQVVRSRVPDRVLRRIETLSMYQGKPLADGEKSLSFKLYLGAENRTLSGEELQQIQTDVVNSIRESAYTLRG